MCIIIVKKAGVELPDVETLKSAWKNNPDGGGYMLPDRKGKCVLIRKGFMTFKAFMKSLNTIKNIKDEQLIIHFRITTHGGTLASNTHPFPLTNNLNQIKALRTSTDIGIAHNGVIGIDNDKGISDTMQFIKDELSLFNTIIPTWYKDVKALEYIGNRIQSKLAIMDSSGYIATIGKFYEEEGVLYSNYSYVPYTPYVWEGYTSILDDYYMNDDIYNELEIMGLLDYEIRELRVMLSDSQIKEILEQDDSIDVLLGYIYR